jgi:hypothetical protein
VTYLIEYLGEFKFIFETVLDYGSVDKMGYFEGKKTESKISRLGTFKERRPGEEKGSRRIKKSLTRLRSATNSMVRKRISRGEPLIVTKPISCFLGFLL